MIIAAGDRNRTAARVAAATAQASCLVSFGIAGALAPRLSPGDVVVSTEIVSPDGSWRADPDFRRRVAGFAHEIGAVQGRVFGSARILATEAEKGRAWEETGALAVDLESDLVARAASDAGIPFLALRTIADPHHRGLPPAALIPLSATGTPRLGRVLASVLRRPQQIGALLALARESRIALAALRAPARALPALLAED